MPKILIEIDTDTQAVVPRVPSVSNEMKAKFIGEFSWDEEAPYHDERGVVHDYIARHAVPWDLCKTIFKQMAAHWIAAAPQPEQAQQSCALSDSDLVKLIYRSGLTKSRELLYEKCKDGIEVDYPTVEARKLAGLLMQQPAPRPIPTSERLAGGRILTCVYCGHEYPQDTPAHGSKVLTDHISQCEKHPMREVIDQRDKLKSALAGLIGASDSAELRNMELIIRLSPAPTADKAAMLDAIHVLLNVAEQTTGLQRPAEPGGGAV